MQNEMINFSVSFGENGTVYGCGHALDTLLYSQSIATEDDVYSEASHYAYESAINELSNEATQNEVIELLNNLEDNEAIMRLSDYDVTLTQTELTASEMLAGDYLLIERPESLRKLMRGVREYAKENWQDRPETSASHLCPESIFNAMQEVYDSSMGYALKEWLHGDRSNEGALSRLKRALFGSEDATISWNTQQGTVDISASPEAIRELYGYDIGDSEPVPISKEITEYLERYALTRCASRSEAQRLKRLSAQQRREEEEAKKLLLRNEAIEKAKQRKSQRTA